MSFYHKLLQNGYQAKHLKDLTSDELALLVQEEHIENMWSPEARMLAAEARRRKRPKQEVIPPRLKGQGQGKTKRRGVRGKKLQLKQTPMQKKAMLKRTRKLKKTALPSVTA